MDSEFSYLEEKFSVSGILGLIFRKVPGFLDTTFQVKMASPHLSKEEVNPSRPEEVCCRALTVVLHCTAYALFFYTQFENLDDATPVQ